MYHPTRGGVRGGRDQFKWDDVKVDKHRENYLGHSIKAPVGRWQKGKDLFWYAKDKKGKTAASEADALKEEIRRIKEEEEQAMREALGLAPKRATRSQGNRLDKHEYAELVKRGSTAEDLGAGHAEAAQVQGLGLYKVPRSGEEPSDVQFGVPELTPDAQADLRLPIEVEHVDETRDKRLRNEDRRESSGNDREKRRGNKHDRRNDSDDRRKHDSEDRRRRHQKEERPEKKQKRRHDSDSE